MDQPPANANPFTAAINGFHVWGHIYGLSSYIESLARAWTPDALSDARSFKSLPAQKALPAPVIIPTYESSSSSN